MIKDVVVLGVGDVYMTNSAAFLIVVGQAHVDAQTGKLESKPGCELQPITEEEVDGHHDVGKIVFENTDEFIGTWREM